MTGNTIRLKKKIKISVDFDFLKKSIKYIIPIFVNSYKKLLQKNTNLVHMRNLLYAFFVLFFLHSFGQIKEENDADFLEKIVTVEKSRAEKKISFKANPNTTNYDLKYHRLEWVVNPRFDNINGVVTSYFVAGENLNSIVFDFIG